MRLRIASHEVTGEIGRAWPRADGHARARCAVDAIDVGARAEAVSRVLRELDAQDPLRGARMRVSLADPSLHLDVVEGDFASLSDRELNAVASACATELLGDVGVDCEVRCQLQHDERHLIISAIPRAQLLMLRDAATPHAVRLTSVQPDFVLQWNAHAPAMPAATGVFAVASGPDIAIAWVADGVIRSISCATLFDDPLGWAANDPAPVDDASDDAERLDTRVGGMLLRLGLKGHSRAAYAPSRPNPLDSIDRLDAHVDRMLTGLGVDPSAIPAYMLVTPGLSQPGTSDRWTVVDGDGGAR